MNNPGYEKKVKIVDGKIVMYKMVPNEALKEQRRFAKEIEKQSWLPEATTKQILDAYNEAFSERYY